METIWWLGLPAKTWLMVILPWVVTGFLPLVAAQVINYRRKGDS